MAKPAEEIRRSDIDDAAARASRMIAVLMRVSSLENIEDIDAYVGSLEAIVFELIARNVDRADRAAARAAYKRGVAMGLQRSDQLVSRDALLDMLRIFQTPLIAAITQAGEVHGRAIGLAIARWRPIAGRA
ncbi:hypothetical protein [Burkholderia territorii]|uniref:hypothetical protein n=1 Tax=Burkholderia territorii TaxID=1503055 RepID=UPI0012DA0E2F|nr:hypothetical protein [Burkholderia territorii]